MYNGDYVFHCYNCDHNTNLYGFLEFIDTQVAKEYALEKYKNEFKSGQTTKIISSTRKGGLDWTGEKSIVPDARKKFPSVDRLPDHHEAVKYLTERKVRKCFWDRIHYSIDIRQWVKDKTKMETSVQNAIVFPLVDETQNEFGVTIRNMNPKSTFRYQTFMYDESHTKVFGLDRLDRSKEVFMAEGIFDALMMPNSLASLDASLSKKAEALNLDKNKTTLVFDNEPRNKYVTKAVERAIKQDWRVAFWPLDCKEKDLNDMTRKGKSIHFVIDNRFSGLEARLQFLKWTA